MNTTQMYNGTDKLEFNCTCVCLFFIVKMEAVASVARSPFCTMRITATCTHGCELTV